MDRSNASSRAYLQQPNVRPIAVHAVRALCNAPSLNVDMRCILRATSLRDDGLLSWAVGCIESSVGWYHNSEWVHLPRSSDVTRDYWIYVNFSASLAGCGIASRKWNWFLARTRILQFLVCERSITSCVFFLGKCQVLQEAILYRLCISESFMWTTWLRIVRFETTSRKG